MKGETELKLEVKDAIGLVDGLEIARKALLNLNTKVEVLEKGILKWDVSQNVPGYKAELYDEGVGKGLRMVVTKAPLVSGE